MISVKNMDHFTFVVKNRGMGLLSCLFIKKNLLNMNPPSSEVMVSQTGKEITSRAKLKCC